MNDETLEIEASAFEASGDTCFKEDASVSSHTPVAYDEAEIPDTAYGETDTPSVAQSGGADSPVDAGAELRAEILKLRAELDGIGSKRAEFISEIKEFASIFGADSVSKIPDEVWESTNSGVPLAAAYALYEKKEALRAQMADRVNQKNASMSAGAIKNATNPEFFSPSEVRAMSAKEGKRNYNRIIESMKKWN
jgi:hypothetical protein